MKNELNFRKTKQEVPTQKSMEKGTAEQFCMSVYMHMALCVCVYALSLFLSLSHTHELSCSGVRCGGNLTVPGVQV